MVRCLQNSFRNLNNFENALPLLCLKIKRIYSVNKVKISRFFFGRKGVRLGRPMVEEMKSILPIVNEFDLDVGLNEDDMFCLIQLGFQEELATTY